MRLSLLRAHFQPTPSQMFSRRNLLLFPNGRIQEMVYTTEYYRHRLTTITYSRTKNTKWFLPNSKYPVPIKPLTNWDVKLCMLKRKACFHFQPKIHWKLLRCKILIDSSCNQKFYLCQKSTYIRPYRKFVLIKKSLPIYF